jgi:hypothetical protein
LSVYALKCQSLIYRASTPWPGANFLPQNATNLIKQKNKRRIEGALQNPLRDDFFRPLDKTRFVFLIENNSPMRFSWKKSARVGNSSSSSSTNVMRTSTFSERRIFLLSSKGIAWGVIVSMQEANTKIAFDMFVRLSYPTDIASRERRPCGINVPIPLD